MRSNQTATEKKLLRLIRDYGYDVQGCVILSSNPFSPRVFGRCRSILQAAENLCPIIREDAYTNRLIALQNGI